MKRMLSPASNPAGLMAAAGALYAAVVMILNAYHHQGVIDPQVIVAALAAMAALLTRQKVTPVKDPRDGNGVPLMIAPPAAREVQPSVTTSPKHEATTPPAGM